MIYICTHKEPAYKLECPNTIIDNTKSNLSENYGHIRGIQLIDNPQDDEVGIFQQRRRLQKTSIPEGYNIVVPWNFCICEMRSQFGHYHHLKYLDTVEFIINDPEFTKYIRIPNNKEEYWHNIFIMKKSDYQKYREFLLSVLAEKDLLEGTDEDNRFLAERIGSYWIWKNIPKDKIYIDNYIEYKK